MGVAVIYEFSRLQGVDGMLRSNRASTDAEGLLRTWEAVLPGRSYETLYDEDAQDGRLDDVLIARLETTQQDIDSHPNAMNELCHRFVLSRRVVAAPAK